MRNTISRSLIFIMILFLEQGCTEPYSAGTQNFDNLLVVEATITNELKKQEIKLTRTYKFEEIRPEIVIDATVTVSDNQGNSFDFHFQNEDSLYVSNTEFQAVPENEYTLNINTNGVSYISKPEVLPAINQVSLDYEKKEIDGEFGVQIFASSYDPTNSSHYYRYEYEETYKVVSPLPGIFEAYLVPSGSPFYPYVLQYRIREEETRVCYKTEKSVELLLINTANLSEDRVIDFPIRFIPKSSYILNNKYSILVKQFTESNAAFTFHQTLKKVAGKDANVLSPNQPGFVNGNISAVDNPDKKVLGYFEVASVSSTRIFLEFQDLYPGEILSPFFTECNILELDPTPSPSSKDFVRLVDYVSTGILLLYKINLGNGFYMMVPPECTDCTTYASNVVPEFWE